MLSVRVRVTCVRIVVFCFVCFLYRVVFLFFPLFLEVVMSFRRSRMGRSNSRKVFSRGAQRVHPRNIVSGPMRGGIRL